jgi:hypothetical protein
VDCGLFLFLVGRTGEMEDGCRPLYIFTESPYIAHHSTAKLPVFSDAYPRSSFPIIMYQMVTVVVVTVLLHSLSMAQGNAHTE